MLHVSASWKPNQYDHYDSTQASAQSRLETNAATSPPCLGEQGMPGQQVVNAVTSRSISTQSVKCIWTGFRADLVSGSASFMFSVQQENVKHISWCQPFHLNKVQRSHQGIEMEPTKGTVSWPKLKQTSGNNNRPYPWGTGREPKPQQTHLGIWRQNPAKCSKQRWCLHSFIKLSWITAN
jgi:hypothetical protein